jgi:hypothetical protein
LRDDSNKLGHVPNPSLGFDLNYQKKNQNRFKKAVPETTPATVPVQQPNPACVQQQPEAPPINEELD